MKGIIIYQSKYGATEQYAKWLSAALRLPAYKTDEVTPAMLTEAGLVIIGTSVYVGRLLVSKWLRQNFGQLAGKKLMLFVVCGSAGDDKVQQAQILNRNLDKAIKKVTRAFFLPGRCVVNNLKWFDRVVLKIGAMLQNDPVVKDAMNNGFDNISPKHLDGLIAAATASLSPGAFDDWPQMHAVKPGHQYK